MNRASEFEAGVTNKSLRIYLNIFKNEAIWLAA